MRTARLVTSLLLTVALTAAASTQAADHTCVDTGPGDQYTCQDTAPCGDGQTMVVVWQDDDHDDDFEDDGATVLFAQCLAAPAR